MKGAAGNESLKQFATSCVNTISSNMTDFERDIAGIPLQCKLLAETYRDEVIRCSKIGFSDINSQPLSQINSMFEMYERHVKMRLGKICEGTLLKRLTSRLLNWKSQVEAIKHVHMYYALELLFREHAHHFRSLKSSYITLNQLCAVGFIEASNSDKIRFVHRTFAEFFVAWFAMEMKKSEKNLSFFLHELLATKSRKECITTPFEETHHLLSFTFNYPVIAYFINGFTKSYIRNHLDPDHTHRVSMLMDSVQYAQVCRIFMASAVSDSQFVPLAVSLWYKPSQLSHQNDLDVSKLLLISAKYSNVELMRYFCAQRDLTNLIYQLTFNSLVFTPLHVAVQRGHYYLVEFLARKYEPGLKNLRYLLHVCVFNSREENKEIIKDKMQIIKLFSIKNCACIDEKLPDGTVPLLQDNVNNELINCLIECGDDVNIVDRKENSILHKVTENPVTPEFYHWLVVSLNERNFKHFTHTNLNKVSPLHSAMEKVELLADTLKLLKLNGADFNAEDVENESPLFYAIRGRRSVSLICAQIELGADWQKKNNADETVLYICAKHGHCHAMKYFLKIFKMDVDAKDKYCNTPLQYAMNERSTEYEIMQQLLITGGADVNSKGWNNCTPFRRALSNRKGLPYSTIKLMVEHGLLVEANADKNGREDLISDLVLVLWRFPMRLHKKL